MNNALEILNIGLRTRKRAFLNNAIYKNANSVIKALDDYIQYIEETEHLQYKNACANIQYYWREVKS